MPFISGLKDPVGIPERVHLKDCPDFFICCFHHIPWIFQSQSFIPLLWWEGGRKRNGIRFIAVPPKTGL